MTIIKYGFCIACMIGLVFYSFTLKNEEISSEPVAGKWKLVQLYPTKYDTFLYKESVQIEIEKEGMTSGFLGCNKFRTECKTSADKIHFETLLTSRKFCNRHYMDLEDHMKELLGSANSFTLVDSNLYLYIDNKKRAAFKKE